MDLTLPDGDGIEIEERATEEVANFRCLQTAPVGVKAVNPSFDVTPHEYVTAIVTEVGVLRAPYTESLKLAVASVV